MRKNQLYSLLPLSNIISFSSVTSVEFLIKKVSLRQGEEGGVGVVL